MLNRHSVPFCHGRLTSSITPIARLELPHTDY